MRETRRPAPERLEDLYLRRRVRDVIGSAHDVADTGFEIVDHARERIEHLSVSPDQHRVRQAVGIDGEGAENPVAPLDSPAVEQKTPVALAFDPQSRAFPFVESERRPVIDRRATGGELGAALELQLLRRLEAFVEPPGRFERPRRSLVRREPVRLPELRIPIESEPVEVLADRIGERVPRPHGIGVIEPQHETTAFLSCEEPVQECCAQIADVQVSGRRRGETCHDHGQFLRCPSSPPPASSEAPSHRAFPLVQTGHMSCAP